MSDTKTTQKICSFFGHRKIEITEELKIKLKEVIENLITDKNVLTFLFGSRSDFNTLCHEIVTDLKVKYPYIKRINYTCRSETCIFEKDRLDLEKKYSKFFKKDIHLLGFEEEFEHKTKYTAGKASYVERNFAMINSSNYCVFYYDNNYQPEMRKQSKKSIYYISNSGTKIAYEYAIKKKKLIINLLQH